MRTAACALVLGALVVLSFGSSEAVQAAKPGLVFSPFHRGDPHNAVVAARGSAPLVALSFDDGPVPGPTRRLLAFLRRARVRATFFVIGWRVSRHPELVRSQLAGRHELASHTWSHPLLPLLAPRVMRAQIVGGARALQRVSGRRPRLFRPPHGYFDRRVSAVVAAAGMRMIGWDVSIDRAAHGRDARAAARLVLGQIRPGSILLAHDTARGSARAIAVLSRVLPELRRRGLRVVTVSELLRAASGQGSAIASSSPPSVPTRRVPSAARAG